MKHYIPELKHPGTETSRTELSLDWNVPGETCGDVSVRTPDRNVSHLTGMIPFYIFSKQTLFPRSGLSTIKGWIWPAPWNMSSVYIYCSSFWDCFTFRETSHFGKWDVRWVRQRTTFNILYVLSVYSLTRWETETWGCTFIITFTITFTGMNPEIPSLSQKNLWELWLVLYLMKWLIYRRKRGTYCYNTITRARFYDSGRFYREYTKTSCWIKTFIALAESTFFAHISVCSAISKDDNVCKITAIFLKCAYLLM